MYQLIVKNGTCVNDSGAFRADVGIQDGKIVQISESIKADAQRVIDASGKLVLPGIVDTHVHLPWPSASFASVDGYRSGTTAGVCGGVTTVIEYVVPDESGRLMPTLLEREETAGNEAYADFSFHTIIRNVTDETMSDMAWATEQGFTSFKVYTAYEGFRLSDRDVIRVLGAAKQVGALVCFHAEDGVLVSAATAALAAQGKTGIEYYPEAHPYEADVEATHRVLWYARYTGTRIHIVHVNTAAAAQLIGDARRSGVPVTGETCPQYLMFEEDVYRSGEAEAYYFVLAPLIRSEGDRKGLWAALRAGDLQTIGTDHCPYKKKQKLQGMGDFRAVPGGVPGIETSLPIIYTYGVRDGRLPLERLVELMSTNPAKIFNLYPRKGTIAIGSDADLVLYDDSEAFRLSAGRLHSQAGHTLYEGLEVAGWPWMTVLRGNVVAEKGELVASEPTGTVLRRPGYGASRSERGSDAPAGAGQPHPTWIS